PRGLRLAAGLLLLALVFLLGVALGRALEERPRPGGRVTEVRTLTPLPQQAPARTVTVTVTETR
ncbi:MAG TPA: hypothetical protein VNJ53_12475, partial [Gaiellaceae bacterium]|nr:hypothetical protein [Gaiellaceae bacterium]